VIRAILDTNVFLQALISRRRSASVRVIKALDRGRFRVIFSSGTIDELLAVLCLPRMRQRHGLSDDEILRFTLSFVTDALILDDDSSVSAALPRDATDARVLSLAAASGADYLVTKTGGTCSVSSSSSGPGSSRRIGSCRRPRRRDARTGNALRLGKDVEHR
jgi:putative PIN family toxin of toxin-antitoxin system